MNTICKIIRQNTVLILQHALGIHWSDYNITLRIFPASICVFEVLEQYLLRRLKKHFQDLVQENQGAYYTIMTQQHLLLVLRHAPGIHWSDFSTTEELPASVRGNFRICLRHYVLLRYILEINLHKFGHMCSGKLYLFQENIRQQSYHTIPECFTNHLVDCFTKNAA